MPNFTDITGLASLAVATAASLVLLPGIARLPGLHQAVLQSAVFALMLIPFGDMPFAAYLRGATGDLSITTLVMICCALSRHWFGCGTADARARRALLLTVALAALALYPMALGVSEFDPYRLGYGEPLFIAALLLIALAAWIRKYHLIASCIALAILAWTAGWYESDNLWDYLLDPWIAIYALFVIARHGVEMFMQRRSF
jgi:hypothetical protein